MVEVETEARGQAGKGSGTRSDGRPYAGESREQESGRGVRQRHTLKEEEERVR